MPDPARMLALYRELAADPRLQRDWQRNQPRVDRALEAPLIVQTSREVATASLLTIKLRFEPKAADYLEVKWDSDLKGWAAQELGAVGTRLIKKIEESEDQVVRAAASQSLAFYRDRSAANPLVRLEWSRTGLSALAMTEPLDVVHPLLKPTRGLAPGQAVRDIAVLILDPPRQDDELRASLERIHGVGDERRDAIAVFAFQRAWPIIDENLWRLMARHAVISPDEEAIPARSYARRRAAFEPLWQAMIADVGESDELAATLYLWSNEAAKFKYQYELS